MSAQDAAAGAIARLLSMRDELELAGRPPGDLVNITRQSLDSILNDLGAVACAVRDLAERGRG